MTEYCEAAIIILVYIIVICHKSTTTKKIPSKHVMIVRGDYIFKSGEGWKKLSRLLPRKHNSHKPLPFSLFCFKPLSY